MLGLHHAINSITAPGRALPQRPDLRDVSVVVPSTLPPLAALLPRLDKLHRSPRHVLGVMPSAMLARLAAHRSNLDAKIKGSVNHVVKSIHQNSNINHHKNISKRSLNACTFQNIVSFVVT